MKKILSISIAAAIAMGFSACQEEEFGYTARDINYTSNFINTFGTPDSQQDWSTVTTVTLNVTAPAGNVYTVYVTSKRLDEQNYNNYLIAQYDQVVCDGSVNTLIFDYPEGYKNAYVSIVAEGTDQLTTKHVKILDGVANVTFENLAIGSSATTRAENSSTPADLTKMSYIIALEDLGGSFDWDFNDVVLSISHVNGQADVDFKLLAAGGTLPASLQFDGSDVAFGNNTDIHKAFGDEEGDNRVNVTLDQAYFTNAAWEKVKDKGMTVTENLPTKKCTKDGYKTASMSDLLAKLFFTIVQADNTTSTIAAPQNYADKAAVGANVPQAILVGNPNWEWPAEGQSIAIKYDTFTQWVTDFSATNWYGAVWDDVAETDPNAIPEGDGETPTEAQAPRR